MQSFLLIVQAVIALLIVLFVLLQQGKGSTMGASFGAGASDTLFGSRGPASFFFKFTALLGALFFMSSLFLTWNARESTGPDLRAIESFVDSVEEKASLLPTLEPNSSQENSTGSTTNESPALPVLENDTTQ